MRAAAAACAAGVGAVLLCAASAPAGADLRLADHDRVLVLAPHPDDEVLGAGGILQECVARGLPHRVVFFTLGDANEWSFLLYRRHPVLLPRGVRAMGEVRRGEAIAAARSLGMDPANLVFLGYPDFGTLNIWCEHWGERPPYRSVLTRADAVPYAEAPSPGAPYKGESILADLGRIVREFRPTRVFVSHPGDRNPDHRALYLFARVCLWDTPEALRPSVHPYLVHFPRWPEPRAPRPAEPMVPPDWEVPGLQWSAFALDPARAERKAGAIREHRSQYEYGARLLDAFVRSTELFGDPPTLACTGAAGGAGPRELAEPVARADEAGELTEEERALFFAVESRRVGTEGTNLVVDLRFSRPLAGVARLSLYAFGQSDDRPFAGMPKLHLEAGATGARLTDQRRPIEAGAFGLRRGARDLSLRIPLALLGGPRRVLTGVRCYLGELPLDGPSWRVIELAPAREAGGGSASTGR